MSPTNSTTTQSITFDSKAKSILKEICRTATDLEKYALELKANLLEHNYITPTCDWDAVTTKKDLFRKQSYITFSIYLNLFILQNLYRMELLRVYPKTLKPQKTHSVNYLIMNYTLKLEQWTKKIKNI